MPSGWQVNVPGNGMRGKSIQVLGEDVIFWFGLHQISELLMPLMNMYFFSPHIETVRLSRVCRPRSHLICGCCLYCCSSLRWVSVGGGLTAESVASMAEARGEARSAAPTHTAPAPPGQQHQHQQQHQHTPAHVAGHRLTLHRQLHGSRGKQ